MALRIESAGKTDVGLVREKNEDSMLIDPTVGLYVVCDGMGGHVGGQVASQLAVATISEVIRSRQRRRPATSPIAGHVDQGGEPGRLQQGEGRPVAAQHGHHRRRHSPGRAICCTWRTSATRASTACGRASSSRSRATTRSSTCTRTTPSWRRASVRRTRTSSCAPSGCAIRSRSIIASSPWSRATCTCSAATA